MLKGYRTLILNTLLAALAGTLQYVVGVDLTQYVTPATATLIVAGANFGLRLITTGPVGTKAK